VKLLQRAVNVIDRLLGDGKWGYLVNIGIDLGGISLLTRLEYYRNVEGGGGGEWKKRGGKGQSIKHKLAARLLSYFFTNLPFT